ncbi:MAG: L-lactate dehydrogenase [Bacteroidia bacterium]
MKSSVAIIGAGNVGSTAAYALIMRNLVSSLILIDVDEKRCQGEVYDLIGALSFGGASDIRKGSLQEAGQANIAIIAAGKAQKPNQTRLELLRENQAIIKSIIQGMQPLRKDLVIIVVTNPVDILTTLVQDIAGLPRNQIFGSGTMLDSQRLRSVIGERLTIAQKSIHLYVLGEHGDAQFVAWSLGDIGGVPIIQFPGLNQAFLDECAIKAKNYAYEIIACKGSTSFGIAGCISAYCQNILFDLNRVTPVSCFQEEFGICLSMPGVLGARGIKQTLKLPLNKQEYEQLSKSAKIIQEAYHLIRD